MQCPRHHRSACTSSCRRLRGARRGLQLPAGPRRGAGARIPHPGHLAGRRRHHLPQWWVQRGCALIARHDGSGLMLCQAGECCLLVSGDWRLHVTPPSALCLPRPHPTRCLPLPCSDDWPDAGCNQRHRLQHPARCAVLPPGKLGGSKGSGWYICSSWHIAAVSTLYIVRSLELRQLPIALWHARWQLSREVHLPCLPRWACSSLRGSPWAPPPFKRAWPPARRCWWHLPTRSAPPLALQSVSLVHSVLAAAAGHQQYLR